MHVPPLTAVDVADMLAPAFNGYEQMATDDRDYLSRAVQALTDGRAAYVRAIGNAMAQMGGTADPVGALTGLLSADGRESLELPVGSRVRIGAAPNPARFVRPEGAPAFFELVRDKFDLPGRDRDREA